MTSQTAPMPAEEWFTLMLEASEARLFRDVTEDEYAEGALLLWAVREALP